MSKLTPKIGAMAKTIINLGMPFNKKRKADNAMVVMGEINPNFFLSILPIMKLAIKIAIHISKFSAIITTHRYPIPEQILPKDIMIKYEISGNKKL
jgi:hypothetical protein